MIVVESSQGMVYCMNCNDLVFDPTLEGARLANGEHIDK